MRSHDESTPEPRATPAPTAATAVAGTPGVRVTAAMVAARAGVSTATVSLVANGKTEGRVSAENIARVTAAIEELGYVVDGIGSSLARGGSNLVILAAPDVANPFFAKVIGGVRAALGSDYQLLLAVSDAGQRPPRRRSAPDVAAAGRAAGGCPGRSVPGPVCTAPLPWCCWMRRGGALRAVRQP